MGGHWPDIYEDYVENMQNSPVIVYKWSPILSPAPYEIRKGGIKTGLVRRRRRLQQMHLYLLSYLT